ncbi:MAG: glutathione S-transferase family protein [Pseudomonadota bacterium]
MKLHTYPSAPNPRRVTIFAAEKDIALELVTVDILKGEQRSADFLQKNPSGKIPVLELEDGRCISESVAICRYLEAIKPEPNLFGRNPFELGHIEARNRQIELELWRDIGTSWVNGPVVGATGRFKQIPEAKEASDKRVTQYYVRLDEAFATSPFVAGERFTVADISLLTAVDFASAMVGLKPDEDLENLYRWHASVSSRPSVSNG